MNPFIDTSVKIRNVVAMCTKKFAEKEKNTTNVSPVKPAEVIFLIELILKKSRIGDWEGDTIIGAEHQGAILFYVDRSSKFTILSKVANKTAELVLHASIEQFQAHGLPVLTITYDNGKEFSNHEKIAQALTILPNPIIHGNED
jgi:IS30 family transposase